MHDGICAWQHNTAGGRIEQSISPALLSVLFVVVSNCVDVISIPCGAVTRTLVAPSATLITTNAHDLPKDKHVGPVRSFILISSASD